MFIDKIIRECFKEAHFEGDRAAYLYKLLSDKVSIYEGELIEKMEAKRHEIISEFDMSTAHKAGKEAGIDTAIGIIKDFTRAN